MDEIQLLLQLRRTAVPTEDEAITTASVEDVNWTAFEQYLTQRPRSEMTDARTIEAIAESTGWLRRIGGNLHPSLATLLLFGREPQRHLPFATVDFARFLGTGRDGDVADRITFDGTLAECVSRCLRKIGDLSVRSYAFESGRTTHREMEEYPFLVVREALANAVVHRDYAHRSASVTARMFDDRVEIQSPGALFGLVTKENFGKVTDYRNRRIAEAFYLSTHLTEMLGRGIAFMQRSMERNGSPPPVFEFDTRYLQVTLPVQPSYYAFRLYQRGVGALSERNLDLAVDLLSTATRSAPNIAEPRVALGTALRGQGRPDDANKALQRALAADPGSASVSVDLAALALDRDEVSTARAVYRQGAQSARNPTEVLRLAAQLELRLGKPQEAAGLLRRACNLSPEDWTLWSALGEVMLRMRMPDDALSALRKAQRLANNQLGITPTLHMLKALILTGAAHDAVRAAFDDVVTAQPRHQEAYQAYYHYATQNGLAEEALKIFEAAKAQGFTLSSESKPSPVFVGGLPNDMDNARFTAWLQAEGFSPLSVQVMRSKDGATFAKVEVDEVIVPSFMRDLSRRRPGKAPLFVRAWESRTRARPRRRE